MHSRSLFSACMVAAFTFLFSNCSTRPVPAKTSDRQNCPVTTPPNPAFVPPTPRSPNLGDNEFFYGTPAIWAIVERRWQRHGYAGQKLPYFRQGHDQANAGPPQLTVVARRLDGHAPLVWNGPVGTSTGDESFMVTGIDIPSPGCWEIGTRYLDTSRGIPTVQTLSYTVWVEP